MQISCGSVANLLITRQMPATTGDSG